MDRLLQQPQGLNPSHSAGGERFLRVLPWGGDEGAKPFRDRGVQGGRPSRELTEFAREVGRRVCFAGCLSSVLVF